MADVNRQNAAMGLQKAAEPSAMPQSCKPVQQLLATTKQLLSTTKQAYEGTHYDPMHKGLDVFGRHIMIVQRRDTQW